MRLSSGSRKTASWVVALAVIVSSGTMGTGVSMASGPGENGRVAYVQPTSIGDGNRTYQEIYTMNPDGTDRRPVTFDGGRFIKYATDYEGYTYAIYTQNASPRWMPDGMTLAYLHHSVDDEVEIRAIDPVIGESWVLFDDWHGTMISWSPDGRRIAYGDDAGLWIADNDGLGPSLIVEPRVGLPPMGPDHRAQITSVKWSPDGSKIAFIEWSGGGLVGGTYSASTIDVATPHRRVDIIDTPLGGNVTVDWAPDGSALVLNGSDGLSTAVAGSPELTALPGAWGEWPAWSPDGASVLYVADGLRSYDVVAGTISLMRSDFVGFDLEWQPIRRVPEPVGLVDSSTGIWRLVGDDGLIDAFYYGNPGDVPFMGDWDCDGDATPGLFRQSDAYAYVRNSNTQGNADIRFYFGNPSDIPIAGDFNGDGCDTVSIYRPSEARFYIINKLGRNDGGLGAADYSFLFGNPGDKPVVGDWDGDGIDEIGLHRESTGLFYWRNTLTTGVADRQIYFGNPGDRFVAGDWGPTDGYDTPAVFRPADTTFYFRHTLTQGNADGQFMWGAPTWLPVARR